MAPKPRAGFPACMVKKLLYIPLCLIPWPRQAKHSLCAISRKVKGPVPLLLINIGKISLPQGFSPFRCLKLSVWSAAGQGTGSGFVPANPQIVFNQRQHQVRCSDLHIQLHIYIIFDKKIFIQFVGCTFFPQPHP